LPQTFYPRRGVERFRKDVVLRDHIDAFIQDTLQIRETGALKRYFVDFAGGFGFEHVAYHYLAEGFKRLSRQKGFRIWKVPETYIKHYLATKAFEFDPLMEEARQRSVPFHWYDIEDHASLSEEQKQFFVDLRAAGFRDGVAVPVYVRPGDIAYFSIGSTEREVDLSRAQMLQLQAICQHMHLRYNELTETAGAPKLSKREMQVLELIAQGKSNATMSAALGVSPNTIDTLVRRCFEKLGVSSRVEAALAGVAMGIILP
jgi:DNA-binding CsgD family transcriptional regulator